jgi:Rad3-related DNA helicase
MPVWPSDYAEELLFLNIPRVVIVSATLGSKSLDLMGIKKTDYEFFDYSSVFPPERSPVYSIPTVGLNHKSSQEDILEAFQRCDDIIADRLDRKGIIHTVSYKRALEYLEASSFTHVMLTHDNGPGSAMEAARRFKEATAPAVLVTPSMTTGYDFPYSQCEYQIIMKAPFADLTDPVIHARKEKDQSYYEYAMAQTLIQSCGRGMRAPDDRCETFIVDDGVDKVVKRKPGNFPAWFRELYRKQELVPLPPPTLAEDNSAALGSMLEAECEADLAAVIDMDDGSDTNV